MEKILHEQKERASRWHLCPRYEGNLVSPSVHAQERSHISIPWSETVKCRGVTSDSMLTWFKAIEKRANLAHSALAKLYPLIAKNSSLKRIIKIRLYPMCVRPIITYGHQIWAAAAKSYTNKVQVMQNKFLRIILNRQRRTPIALLHQQANIPTISTINTYKTHSPVHTTTTTQSPPFEQRTTAT